MWLALSAPRGWSCPVVSAGLVGRESEGNTHWVCASRVELQFPHVRDISRDLIACDRFMNQMMQELGEVITVSMRIFGARERGYVYACVRACVRE